MILLIGIGLGVFVVVWAVTWFFDVDNELENDQKKNGFRM